MKSVKYPLLGIGLVAATLLGAGLGRAVPQTRGGPGEIDMFTLPPAVSSALERAGQMYTQPLHQVKWLRAYQLGGSNHPLYQIQGVNSRNNQVEMEVTGAGRIVEAEEHGIPASEVPEAVLKTLQAELPGFRPDKVEAIYQAGKPDPVCYGFEGRATGNKEVEMYISADGKRILN